MSTTKIVLTQQVTGVLPSANGGNTGENLLINSGFVINNGNAGVPYVSAAALAAGATGHECWKAGASGGDYSFTQLKSNTQVTIASSKSLIQVVEDVNVQGTTYVLSWVGTALARAGVNSATPGGTYVSSPLIITGQTAGTTMSVEFSNGTLLNPLFESGSVVTTYPYQRYEYELWLSQRYFEVLTYALEAHPGSNAAAAVAWAYKASKRTTPTITFGAGSISAGTYSNSVDGFSSYTTGAQVSIITVGTTSNARL